MSSPANELAQYLADAGVGEFPGSTPGQWAIFVAQDSPTPDTTITLSDQGGGEPDTDELDIQNATVQIRVRSAKVTGYNAAYAKHKEIRELLIHPAPLVTGTMRFIGVRMINNIANLGRDDNDRHILVATYEAQLQE